MTSVNVINYDVFITSKAAIWDELNEIQRRDFLPCDKDKKNLVVYWSRRMVSLEDMINYEIFCVVYDNISATKYFLLKFIQEHHADIFVHARMITEIYYNNCLIRLYGTYCIEIIRFLLSIMSER